MLRFALLSVLISIPASAAFAEPQRVAADKLRSTFAGSVVHVDTPLGLVLKIEHLEDGSLSGNSGQLAFYMGSTRDRGRWWIDGNRVCQQWTVWFEAKRNCLEIRMSGQRIAWRRDDGEEGTATLVAAAPKPVFAMAQAVPVTKPEMKPAMKLAAPAERVQAPTAGPKPPVSGLASASPGAAKPKPISSKPLKNDPGQPVKPNLEAKSKGDGKTKPEPTPELPPEPSYRVAGVADYDVLNIRSGPSQEYAVVGALPPRSQGVRLTGECFGEWCVITHKSLRGWVNRYFLVVDRPVASIRQ